MLRRDRLRPHGAVPGHRRDRRAVHERVADPRPGPARGAARGLPAPAPVAHRGAARVRAHRTGSDPGVERRGGKPARVR